MNAITIIEALFVVLCASAAGLVLCAALVGIWWFTVERQHEADALTAAELGIPQDREFTEPQELDYLDPDWTPCTPNQKVGSVAPRGPLLENIGCNVTLPPSAQDARDPRRAGASAFPHDTDYESQTVKRF